MSFKELNVWYLQFLLFFQLASQLIFKIYYDQHFTFPRLHSWPIPKYVNWIFDIIQAHATPFHLRLHKPLIKILNSWFKVQIKLYTWIYKVPVASSSHKYRNYPVMSESLISIYYQLLLEICSAAQCRWFPKRIVAAPYVLLGQSPHVDVSSNLWLNRVSPNMACPHTCMYMWHQF